MCVYLSKEPSPVTPKQAPHRFDLPQQEDADFPREAQLLADLRTQEKVKNAIVNAVALVSLRLQIPVNRVSQPALGEFIMSILKIGRSVGTADVSQLVEGISARAINEKITELGHLFKERDFSVARELRYVNIVVDAGTVLGVAVIHSLLSNPYHKEFPLVLDVTENNHFDKFMYRDLFEKLCTMCHEQGCIVCSIITDGLRAQVSGLEMLLREKESCSTIYQIRCFAHLTNLVFVDCLKQSPYLKSVVLEISSLVRLLRSPAVAEELNEKCPSLCPTRWLYLFDVLIWLYSRQDKIDAFLLASDNNTSSFGSLPGGWKNILQILRPLKLLSLAVESSDCALWEIIPLVTGVMKAWSTIVCSLDSDALEVLRILVANFIWRFSRSSPTVVVTAFTLSEQGRDLLRSREVGFQTRGSMDTPCFTTKRMRSIADLQLNVVDERVLRDAHSPVVEESNSATEVTLEFQEEEDEEDADQAGRDELCQLALERLMLLDIYPCNHSTALQMLIALGKRLGVPERYIEEKFRLWIYADRSDTPTKFCLGQSPDAIWRRVRAFSEEWRQFADICLRFVSIGTSEADCERSLSRQNDIQGLHTTNIRTETLETGLRA